LVPRGKAPRWVSGDASLEGQQGVPLAGHAGGASAMANSSSWRKPQCLRLRGGGGGCDKEKQDGGGIHEEHSVFWAAVAGVASSI
jgi:hypothetical protein